MTEYADLSTYEFHEREWDSYEALREWFEWDLPDRFNMAEYVCDRWAETDGERVAVYAETKSGDRRTLSFNALRKRTNCLANAFTDRGVGRGDRVAINLPQRPETLLTHIAAWKVGAVTIPLSTLFGPDGLETRLAESEATLVVVDETNLEAMREVAPDLPSLNTILTVGVDDREADEVDFERSLMTASPTFDVVKTTPADDAVVIYTSGTTGDPKGVLHGHRLLLGQLPFFLTTYANLELTEDDVFWTPANWAWVSIFIIVFPPLYYGKPVLAYQRGPFEPESAFELIERYGVTVGSFPPTSMRMMMQVEDPAARWELSSLRLVPTGGEEVGESLIDWVDETFDGASVHTAFGQSEANGIIGECEALFSSNRSSLGRPGVGHEVTIVDRETAEPIVKPGELGEIAVRYEDDPLLFKRYLEKPEQTSAKVQNGWLLTEDLGAIDRDGYITYHSRKDDVIITAGYRVSPGEIEDALGTHSAVIAAGVIGVPDEERGQIPKAVVELDDGVKPSGDLKEELEVHVRDTLAKYESPREIEFFDELPKTVTGKIKRSALKDREEVTD
jgi:acetyl-CoA synthetase